MVLVKQGKLQKVIYICLLPEQPLSYLENKVMHRFVGGTLSGGLCGTINPTVVLIMPSLPKSNRIAHLIFRLQCLLATVRPQALVQGVARCCGT